ncbi:acylphosphatase [Salisediminibacterium selenitireducens]|uniref:Acylphosphatase n=1 Tax=Bacillus selenitireducens (strain ATCC 700615 / DSM 15326 / MLS10) TaxID=439292 RepID=D6XYK0_BACIE|nr:acylphosphatase [Salisediminibacterium selenitireducens]ADI00269.1 acylphosphatase [[Bacillus] selenitireducens MLS10]
MQRIHAIVSGRVQGVGFRYQAKVNAEMKGLSGWVRNKRNGDVELEVQGDRETISSFFDSLYELRFPAKIKQIEKAEKEPVPNEEQFIIYH